MAHKAHARRRARHNGKIKTSRTASACDGVAFMPWSLSTVLLVSLWFILAGLAEIGGGWLVWQAVREGKAAWWAVAGSAVLVTYGFIPTLQPLDDFGRLYAVYGGVFIGMSFAWGYVFDGIMPDRGDLLGSAIALLGVAICLFWPRGEQPLKLPAFSADGAGHPLV
jgi:drug/metabolite transporter superfamily protein YnfA